MPRETTSPASWSIGTLISALEAAEANNTFAPRIIKIPQFQRNISWSKEKQKDLIDSINRGFPIGSLMLYQKQNNQETKEYQLVDGLQRANSIWNYKKKPLEFFQMHVVGQEISELLETINSILDGDISITKLQPILDKWRIETQTLDRNDGFDSYTLMSRISAELNIPSDRFNDLSNPTHTLLSKIESLANIDSQEIPIIIYEGDPVHLPNIFQRINTGSVQLSKYQILAAQWIDKGVRTENAGIINSIKMKVQSLKDEGFEIDEWDENRNELEISLYEFLFGLGKIITERFPMLFKSKKSHEEESVGFALLTIHKCLQISKMSNLASRLYDEEESVINLDEFANLCLEATDFVNSCMEPFVGLKLNESKRSHAHSVNQIISMIGRVSQSIHQSKNSEFSDRWQTEKRIFKRTLPQHYLVDLLQKNWRGSGDARLFNMCWQQDSTGDFVLGNHFLTEYNITRMKGIINNWYENQSTLGEFKRNNISDASKVFLKYLYCNSVSYRDNASISFELEHLFPVSRLINLIHKENKNDGWPINCISNLALFTLKTNRQKSNKTISEFLATIQDLQTLADYKNEMDRMLFCDTNDVNIPESDGVDSMTKHSFLVFLDMRMKNMTNQITNNLSLIEEEAHREVAEPESAELDNLVLHEERGFERITDILIKPTASFFSVGFTVPVDQTQAFINTFGLSEERIRVPIMIEINGSTYNSSIRIIHQRTRKVVQVNFNREVKNAIAGVFQQSFLDVTYQQLATESCCMKHISDDIFSISKVE